MEPTFAALTNRAEAPSITYSDLTCLIVGGDEGVSKTLFERGFVVQKDPGKAYDIMVLTGGPDIVPFLYGENPVAGAGVYTHWDRDRFELKTIKAARHLKPKVGICRGAQLLNVLSGGKLWQDVEGHKGSHALYDKLTKRQIEVTSTHHQMMRPASNALVVATAGQATRCQSEDFLHTFSQPNDKPDEWRDSEVIWYSGTASLCFQPHPEYGLKSCTDYFFELIDRFIMPQIIKERTI